MPDQETLVRYLLFGLGGLFGTTGVIAIFIRLMAEGRGFDWHEDDSSVRHRWGVMLLLA